MWAYLFFIPRTEGRSAEDEVAHSDKEFSKPAFDNPNGIHPLFTYVGKKRVWVLVKADLTDAQAETISNNDCLLAGTAKLIWWDGIMEGDFRRTLDRNEANADRAVAELEELATLLKASRPVCNDGTNESALAFLAEKVGTLPDGPDKDRLLEALRQDAKKPEAKPDYLGFMAELKTLVPFFKQAATVEGADDKAVIESLIAKAKEMPDGMAKESALEVLSELLGAATKGQPEAKPTGTEPAGLLQNLMKNLRQF